MRRVWVVLGLFFLLLVGGMLGLNAWVLSYLRSENFRQLVSAKTGQALKADADYAPLQWTGASVFSQTLSARGEAGAPIEMLEAEQVRASVNWRAVFQGAWKVDHLEAARLDLKIRSERQKTVSAAEPGPTPEPQPPKRGFLPNRFELDRVQVQIANIDLGGQAKMKGTALVAKPEGQGWVFDGKGGQLEAFNRPSLDIVGFQVRLQKKTIYLTNADFRMGANGNIRAWGEVSGESAPYDISIKWQSVETTSLLDATWKNRLSGTLSGEARSLGRDGKPPLQTGKFLLAEGMLKGLPVQKEIAKFTRSPQFERIPLQEVSGDFAYDGRTVEVRNFVAESQGLLRLEGDFRVKENGSLKGEFLVGVSSQSLQWLPGSQEKVFRTSERGYLWTEVKIGGTIKEPKEDLSGRLARAMGEQVIDTGVELIKGTPGNAVDAVQKAVDLLSPLIP